jgi:hypothetical protein
MAQHLNRAGSAIQGTIGNAPPDRPFREADRRTHDFLAGARTRLVSLLMFLGAFAARSHCRNTGRARGELTTASNN